MSTITAGSHAHDDAHSAAPGHTASFISKYVFSKDHKVIGIQFLFSTLLWFLVGGLLALGVRFQVAWPWAEMPVIGKMLFANQGGQISPEFYTVLFTMHATVMIFFVIIPILAGAFGNFLIPLMIGADDMAFPTLNMLSYWFMWPAFIAIGASFFVAGGAAKAGWTSYPPLSLTDVSGQTLWLVGRHVRGHLVDDGLDQLYDNHHSDAGPRHDDVPPADDHLGDVHYGHSASVRVAGAYCGRVHAVAGHQARDRVLHS